VRSGTDFLKLAGREGGATATALRLP